MAVRSHEVFAGSVPPRSGKDLSLTNFPRRMLGGPQSPGSPSLQMIAPGYLPECVLAETDFSQIYLSRCPVTGARVAVKVSATADVSALNEFSILDGIEHRAILKPIALTPVSETVSALVLPFAASGDLFGFLTNRSDFGASRQGNFPEHYERPDRTPFEPDLTPRHQAREYLRDDREFVSRRRSPVRFRIRPRISERSLRVGSPAYAAPEIVLSRRLTRRRSTSGRSG